jgi:hypothetical protein
MGARRPLASAAGLPAGPSARYEGVCATAIATSLDVDCSRLRCYRIRSTVKVVPQTEQVFHTLLATNLSGRRIGHMPL